MPPQALQAPPPRWRYSPESGASISPPFEAFTASKGIGTWGPARDRENNNLEGIEYSGREGGAWLSGAGAYLIFWQLESSPEDHCLRLSPILLNSITGL
jgi:hypothetical protein